MRTATTRRQHSRAGLRYASDVTDAEWGILEALHPRPACRGRRWAWPLREIINAIFYVLRASCAWRLLPDSFPPWRTMYRWFARLRDGGVWEAMNHHLVMLDRERCGREASPTAAVIDSQSVKTTESGAPAPAPLPGGDHLHLLKSVSHTHGHTPNPYGNWRPCPINSGAASLRDRLSFMRFAGLSLHDAVPDAKMIWLYREQLTRAGALARVFAEPDPVPWTLG